MMPAVCELVRSMSGQWVVRTLQDCAGGHRYDGSHARRHHRVVVQHRARRGARITEELRPAHLDW